MNRTPTNQNLPSGQPGQQHQQAPPTEQNAGQQQQHQQHQQHQPVSFEAWLKDQPKDVQALYDQHTKGLRSALDSEREQRSQLAKELKEVSSKLDKDSDAKKTVDDVSTKLEEYERRATFYEVAAQAGCINLKLAYLAATNDELFDRYGRVQLDTLKTNYPQLFAASQQQAQGRSNAGSGGGQQQEQKRSMNDFIRAASGRSR